MSKKKWLKAGAVGVGLVLMVGLLTGCRDEKVVDSTLRIYTTDQTASSHAGYRRDTLTSGDDVFVHDYEEAGLQLVNPEPTDVIGHVRALGDAKVCALFGLPATSYIAGDCGSEMPAYVPYRNVKQPAFDWRTATFREMKAYGPHQSDPIATSTEATLLNEVVRTLRDGTPVELPGFSFAHMADLAAIKMTSDQLPGLLFCPYFCTDEKGQIYLAESLMIDDKSNPLQLHARWIPASAELAQWLKTH